MNGTSSRGPVKAGQEAAPHRAALLAEMPLYLGLAAFFAVCAIIINYGDRIL